MFSDELTPDIIEYGDSALLVQFKANSFSLEINNRIHQLSKTLSLKPDWQELVPGYDSLLCCFDMTNISIEKAKKKIAAAIKKTASIEITESKVIEVPVVYGGKYGPDMAAIKKSSGLNQSQIIEIHSAQPYRVCMMGFIPGFCFLSEIPSSLKHPRHKSPRSFVPAGSVGIAGWQTGIYGLDSPGGWQIIGRTPHKIFDKNREKPFLLRAGDKIKFIPSSKAIFS